MEIIKKKKREARLVSKFTPTQTKARIFLFKSALQHGQKLIVQHGLGLKPLFTLQDGHMNNCGFFFFFFSFIFLYRHYTNLKKFFLIRYIYIYIYSFLQLYELFINF